VITELPADTPVTRPEVLTVATAGDAETQGLETAAVPEPVKVVVAPTHAEAVPVIVGKALMVTV
jgi:hypothetical protein